MNDRQKEIEERIGSSWSCAREKFDEMSDKPPFFLLMPVPNITGNLHIGHALNLTLQDIIARWKTLSGKNVFWAPGTDHAGIGGQHVAEQYFITEGVDLKDVPRDEMLARMNQWKDRIEKQIFRQMKSLGLSLTWDRKWFTMDADRNRTVLDIFIKLYEQGVIYREEGIVNWCTRCETSLSDMELNLIECKESMTVIKVMLDNAEQGLEYLPLTLIKPELLYGCTAIGFRSDDKRFHEYAGMSVILPVTGRPVPILAVDSLEADFGSGLSMIVPAFSGRDYAIARANGLDIIQLFDKSGKMAVAGAVQGYSPAECRDFVIDQLKKNDLVIKVVEFPQGRAECYRCGSDVVPRLSRQWHMQMKDNDTALKYIQKDLVVNDEYWKEKFMGWYRQVFGREAIEKQEWWEGACVGVAMGYSSNKDWVISRQLKWGQQIPAWHCTVCETIAVSTSEPDSCRKCGGRDFKQDEDVLDVWFSCATWPVSVNPWSGRPVMADAAVMGHDIYYFWVASSNIISFALFDKPAFSQILVHGLLTDTEGKKMSKSLGNVIDLEETIREFGAEVTRIGLLRAFAKSNNHEWLKIGKQDFLEAEQEVNHLYGILGSIPISGTDGRSLDDHDLPAVAAEIEACRLAEAYEKVVALLDRISSESIPISVPAYRKLLAFSHPFLPYGTDFFFAQRLNAGSSVTSITDLQEP